MKLSRGSRWTALEKNNQHWQHGPTVKLKFSGKWKINILIKSNGTYRLRKMMPLQSAGEVKTFEGTTVLTILLIASSCSKNLLF